MEPGSPAQWKYYSPSPRPGVVERPEDGPTELPEDAPEGSLGPSAVSPRGLLHEGGRDSGVQSRAFDL